MDFFKLDNQFTEDKVVERDTRIYADTMKILPFFDDHAKALDYVTKRNNDITDFPTFIADYDGTTLDELSTYLSTFPQVEDLTLFSAEPFKLKTTSNAHRQKIKFFFDVIDYNETDVNKSLFFNIGKYFEMEHNEKGYINNSSGYFTFTFTCSQNDGNGNFEWNLIFDEVVNYNLTMFISSVVFEDSFYNSDLGWLNPDNTDNMIDKLEKEINQGLPAGAETKDFLVIGSVTQEPEWQNGEEVVEYLPKATDTQLGVVKVDNATIRVNSGMLYASTMTDTVMGVAKVDNNTIKANAGTISVSKASATQLGAVKVDNNTIVAVDGVISAVGGGGGGGSLIHYSTSEQDTGLKWHNGKNIYQRTFINPANGTIILTGVSELINEYGFASVGTGIKYSIQYFVSSQYAYTSLDTTGKVTWNMVGMSNATLTVFYTKL